MWDRHVVGMEIAQKEAVSSLARHQEVQTSRGPLGAGSGAVVTEVMLVPQNLSIKTAPVMGTHPVSWALDT